MAQNPNEDTEWNSILREKGILPQKPKEKEFTEDDIVNMVESAVQKQMNNTKDFADMTLDEIEALEDDEDEKIVRQYRQQRLQEIKDQISRARYGKFEKLPAKITFKKLTRQAKAFGWFYISISIRYQSANY